MAVDRLEGYRHAIRTEALIGLPLMALASTYGATTVGAAAALLSLIVLPLCTRSALAPEDIPTARFLEALKPSAIAAIFMLLVLALWW